MLLWSFVIAMVVSPTAAHVHAMVQATVDAKAEATTSQLDSARRRLQREDLNWDKAFQRRCPARGRALPPALQLMEGMQACLDGNPRLLGGDKGNDDDIIYLPLGNAIAYRRGLQNIRLKFSVYRGGNQQYARDIPSHFWVAVVPNDSPLNPFAPQCASPDDCVFLRFQKHALYVVQFNNMYVGSISYSGMGLYDGGLANPNLGHADFGGPSILPNATERNRGFPGRKIFLLILVSAEAARFEWVEDIFKNSILPLDPPGLCKWQRAARPTVSAIHLHILVEFWLRTPTWLANLINWRELPAGAVGWKGDGNDAFPFLKKIPPHGPCAVLANEQPAAVIRPNQQIVPNFIRKWPLIGADCNYQRILNYFAAGFGGNGMRNCPLLASFDGYGCPIPGVPR